MQQQFARHIGPTGEVRPFIARDLGNLRDRPPAPRATLLWRARNWVAHKHRGAVPHAAALIVGRLLDVVTVRAALSAVTYRPDLSRLDVHQLQRLMAALKANVDVRLLPAHFGGLVLDFGVISRRLVTNAGAGFLVDALQNLVEAELLKFHGIGTGTTAEAAGDTALVTELTTQYNPDNTRATGSLTELSAQVFRTVGTNTVDAAAAVTEHGIFSQAATGGGVLLDRSVFAVINLANGDSLQTTYDLTINSGN